MPFAPGKRNEVQSWAEWSLTDTLLKKLCEKEKAYSTERFGGVKSVVVVHTLGSFATLPSGAFDVGFHFALAIAKFATGFFISIPNMIRAPFVDANAKPYAPEWGWTASVNHFRHGCMHLLYIPQIFFRTLLGNPQKIRENLFDFNYFREIRIEMEKDLARLQNAASTTTDGSSSTTPPVTGGTPPPSTTATSGTPTPSTSEPGNPSKPVKKPIPPPPSDPFERKIYDQRVNQGYYNECGSDDNDW